MLIGNQGPIDPDRRAYLAAKYVAEPPPGAVAAGEQLAQAMRDMRTAAEAWNREQGSAEFLNWGLPDCLRAVIDRRLTVVRESEARQSRGGGNYIHYYDDRNGWDAGTKEQRPPEDCWPVYDPDCPGHQNVCRGHILSDVKREAALTVHILRGGTEPLFSARDGLAANQRPDDVEPPNDGLVDWGHSYTFLNFMAHADHTRMLHFCDAALPGGCRKGIGGGPTTLCAIPMGRDVFAMHICEDCLLYAEAELTRNRVDRGDY